MCDEARTSLFLRWIVKRRRTDRKSFNMFETISNNSYLSQHRKLAVSCSRGRPRVPLLNLSQIKEERNLILSNSNLNHLWWPPNDYDVCSFSTSRSLDLDLSLYEPILMSQGLTFLASSCTVTTKWSTDSSFESVNKIFWTLAPIHSWPFHVWSLI